MKKTQPPVTDNKEIQRSHSSENLDESQPQTYSFKTSLPPPDPTTSETSLQSSSLNSFKARRSEALTQQSFPPTEVKNSKSNVAAFSLWLPKSKKFTFTKSMSNLRQPRLENSSHQIISSETVLQATSVTSLKANQPPRTSDIEIASSNSEIFENKSFNAWVPKARKFTLTKTASYFTAEKNALLNLSSGVESNLVSEPKPDSSPDPLNKSVAPEPPEEEEKEVNFFDIVASQSYKDSLNFFGSNAITAPITSPNIEPATPRSFFKPRFSTVVQQSIISNESSENDSENDYSRGRYSVVSENSTYSAANTARQYSNPFLNPYRLKIATNVQPRSASQALSDTSRAGNLKTRFAEPPSGVKDIPFCGKSKCCQKCCANCSIYDPVCNIPCCFPYLQIFWLCTLAYGFCALWVSLFAIWGDMAWPGGEIFQFYTLAVSAYVMGWIFAWINLPPTLGMFAAGIICGNMEWIHPRSSISATTREIVVAFIILRAGLNTEANIFKTHGGLISRIAFVPGISEMLIATMFGVFLFKVPLTWALLFGTIIAASSPLAIIYSLVWLRENGYGENKGVASVLLMMYALDNITLVTLFGIFFTLTFDVQFSSGRALGIIAFQTITTICGGIAAGFIMGTFITFFPHRYDPYCGMWRTVLLSCNGLGTILFTHFFNWDGAGYLCTIVMAFTASTGWKSLGTPNCVNPVNVVFAMAWHVLQPIALGLIGAEVNIFTLDKRSVKSALIVVPCCMLQARFSMAFIMSGMRDFNLKERLFIALLSMTKGTPQAALAPMTMDLAENKKEINFAKHLLDICVLEVLITLPLGPLIASYMGTRLLSRTEPTENRDSWSETPASRQRFKSVVNRINTDNEFMLFTETASDLDNESNV